MKLELREHELEQAIEVFISSFVNQPVKVNGFDLSGMRSKDGLSAMVDFTVVGVSDVREAKTESTNVNPTNTSWREEKVEIAEHKNETVNYTPKSEVYYQVLELLSNNPQNINGEGIRKLLKDNPEVEDELSTNTYYTQWKLINSEVKEEISDPVLDEEEAEMDKLTLSEEDTETIHDVVNETESLQGTVTNSILDEVTQPEDKQAEVDRVTGALSGKKPVRPLFG